MSQRGVSPIACTITTESGLARARVLASSYLERHPGHRFATAVLDGPDGLDDTAESGPGILLGPDRLGLDQAAFRHLATACPAPVLAAAVKPFLLRELARDGGTVTYLDPSSLVLADLGDLADAARAHGTVVVPHFTEPVPADLDDHDEGALVGTGRLNPGVLAVGPASAPLLDAWADAVTRLTALAWDDPFPDQAWLDAHVPQHDHHELRDPGLGLAPWNAFARPVTRGLDGTARAQGAFLRLVQLPGYDPARPWLLTGTAVRPLGRLSDQPELRAVCDGYRDALLARGFDASEEETPSWLDALPDGTAITPLVRALYRDAAARAASGRPGRREEAPPDAFRNGGKDFRDWLTGRDDPETAVTGLRRWPLAVWRGRADLRAAYPDPGGADRSEFRHWCRTWGVADGELAAWAVPGEPDPVPPPTTEFGVNLVGHLTAELGVGELGRALQEAIAHSGVPVRSVVEDRLVVNRTGIGAPGTIGAPRFGVSVFCVNADLTPLALAMHPDAAQGRYRIGVWSWELEEFPESLHGAFDHVDEIWANSEFCRRAIAAHTDKPVHTLPVPVHDPGEPVVPQRDPADPVRFLFAFDYNSVAARKNPSGLVEAFRRAFGDRGDVELVIKAINGDQHFAAAERLRARVAGDDRITLVERYLSVAELDELYRRADCYVSLHRSEGFGFTLAEAMARGLPVIATDYSGNTEFTDPDGGWPIGWTRVPVGPDAAPYAPDSTWAEPDLDAAAEAMRAVADDPESARKRGRVAREHVLRTRSVQAAADWVAHRLELAHRRWSERSAGPTPERGDAGVPASLASAREALRWRAEADSPSRLPGLAPALRRAVLRVIDHYDVHQRRVLGAVLDGVDGAFSRMAERIDSVEDRVDDGARRRDRP